MQIAVVNFCSTARKITSPEAIFSPPLPFQFICIQTLSSGWPATIKKRTDYIIRSVMKIKLPVKLCFYLLETLNTAFAVSNILLKIHYTFRPAHWQHNIANVSQ
jgi:hypothetical protein